MSSTFGILDTFGLEIGSVRKRVGQWQRDDFLRFFEEYEANSRATVLVRTRDRGATDVFPDTISGRLPTPLIRQLCVYVNRIYIHDPIIDLLGTFQWLDNHFERIIRTPDAGERLSEYRIEFSKVLEEFLELRPLVELGVVHVSPTHLVLPKREPGTIYASDLYGPDGQFVESKLLELPEALCNYINNNIQVSSAEFSDGTLRIYPPNKVAFELPTIAVRFSDGVAPSFYCLSTITPGEEKDGKLDFSMSYNFKGGEPMAEEKFRVWSRGESLKFVRERLNELSTNLYLSSAAGANFLTGVPSSRELLSAALEEDTGALPTLLQIELPYLSNVSINDLANARKNEGSFQEFRAAFDNAVAEVESLPASERENGIDQIARDLIHRPVAQIEQQMKSLHRNVLTDSLFAVGAFATTIVSGGGALLAAASLAASAKALDSYKKAKDKEDEIRSNSSFFFWEATKKARK